MTAQEREAAVDLLASDPEAGDVVAGTGGCRKVRLAARGKGKSGGYRLLTYFVRADGRVLLLTVFSKADRANLSKADRNGLARLTKRLDTEGS